MNKLGDPQAAIRAVSLRAENHKGLHATNCALQEIKPINIIVGKNNSGKSAFLDLVELAHSANQQPPADPLRQRKLLMTLPMTMEQLQSVFPQSQTGDDIAGNHWFECGRKLVGNKITVSLHRDEVVFVSTEPDEWPGFQGDRTIKCRALANQMGNPFHSYVFERLSAERDITVEPTSNSKALTISRNGAGLTALIERFINDADFQGDLVESVMLTDLKSIVGNDGAFDRIQVRRLANGHWEIFLSEPGKGAIPLSSSGSGLKTIFLIVAFLRLLPKVRNRPIGDFIFAFEEPEGHLHPALQRRLMSFIRDEATSHGATVFITTHSNTIIDQFAKQNDAQIIHVTHDGASTKAHSVSTYLESNGVLDDLDVRASDLLQANGIVWVESPSDRLYFNRWIELWTDGKLLEGTHYQCVFYGGRLLAHLDAQPIEEAPVRVQLLRVARNAILLMDSDKAAENDELNSTKVRLMKELIEVGCECWVTLGREVENYIGQSALASVVPSSKKPLRQYESFADYLQKNSSPAERKKFERDKVGFAARVLPFFDERRACKDTGSCTPA